jgi:iron complex transport system substrate-binding protein
MRIGPLWLAAAALLASPVPQSTWAQATRQVTDAAGRVVTLPVSVNRIADPWHANNAMVLMLGGADKIVATTVQAQRQPWLRKLYPRIDQVPAAFNAAGDLNIETLIGARPDVILMRCRSGVPRWRPIMCRSS